MNELQPNAKTPSTFFVHIACHGIFCICLLLLGSALATWVDLVGLENRNISSTCVKSLHSAKVSLVPNYSSDVTEICSPRITEGVFTNYTFTGISGCVLPFVELSNLGESILRFSGKNRFWIHFIGDSDTRGLVMALIRFLHPPLMRAQNISDFARACGCFVNLTNLATSCGKESTIFLHEFSRVGMIDFQMTSGSKGGFGESFSSIEISHRLLNQSCFTSTPIQKSSLESHRSFRISFEMRGPREHFNRALKCWGSGNDSNSIENYFPDLFYLNAGAWWSGMENNSKMERSHFLNESVSHVRELSLHPHSNIIYGTSLHWRYTEFDKKVISDLSRTSVLVFDRFRFSQLIMSSLQLRRDSGHAPLIVNLYDAQRFAQTFMPLLTLEDSGSYIPTFFHEDCKRNINQKVFLGSWVQHCHFF